ncbi:SRPBCC family protein [Mesorhizobium sp. ZC-5]|uniref:SRPBCC family protein n=1 Tax=Mesorhizobium sp. ZC-5 TaxID=2986066 RepID=UPI0021E72F98|nr:SRPBCC family protein [Mesorhizobium sp. ZC-5]MCV3238932.1 SRPBCC family protein [Mesorhizobium sp. ZC-5]
MKDMANLFETWSLDREIVLVKLLKHPRSKVFAAWMDPKALAQWYGPAGLAIENHEADIREGGVWRFDMVGMFEGKEQRFPNMMRFLKIVPDELIVVDYGTPEPDDPERFHMTITFDEQADGKTVLTMRQLHPSAKRRQAVIGFGAVEYGLQTLDGLAAWLDG